MTNGKKNKRKMKRIKQSHWIYIMRESQTKATFRAQELCESRGGRPRLQSVIYHWQELPQYVIVATKNVFVATKIFCRNKHTFVTTKVLRIKHTFVATKDVFLCLSRQKWYLWQLPPMILISLRFLWTSSNTSTTKATEPTWYDLPSSGDHIYHVVAFGN